MIYAAMEFKLNAIVSFGNRLLISIASKSWNRMKCGILVPTQASLQHLS